MAVVSTGSVSSAPPESFLARWVSRGAWAVVDQAFFSLANLLVLLLLGRWLEPVEFGRFAVAHTIFLLLATVHTAMIVEPMLVFGAGRFSRRLPRYLGAVMALQTPLTLATAAVMGLIGAVCLIFDAATARPILAMAVAAPFMLLLWGVRRPWYVIMRPHRAAAGGAVYLIVVTLALQLLALWNCLNSYTAIGVMAAASAVAAIVLMAGMPMESPHFGMKRRVRAAHLNYGRWAVAAGFLGLLPTQLCYLVLPEFAGVESAGALRAISSLILPFIQLNIAISGILLPALSKHRNTSHGRRIGLAGAGAMVVAPLAGGIFLAMFAEILLKLCYGDLYIEFTWLLRIIAIAPALLGLNMLLNMHLQTRGRQDAVFYASLASAIFAATIGVAMIAYDGLRGAAVGVNLGVVVGVVVSSVFVLRVISESGQRSQETGDRSQ